MSYTDLLSTHARGAPKFGAPNFRIKDDDTVPLFKEQCASSIMFKVCAVSLLRYPEESECPNLDSEGKYNGTTEDIQSHGRKGDSVYLAWETCYVGP